MIWDFVKRISKIIVQTAVIWLKVIYYLRNTALTKLKLTQVGVKLWIGVANTWNAFDLNEIMNRRIAMTDLVRHN